MKLTLLMSDLLQSVQIGPGSWLDASTPGPRDLSNRPTWVPEYPRILLNCLDVSPRLTLVSLFCSHFFSHAPHFGITVLQLGAPARMANMIIDVDPAEQIKGDQPQQRKGKGALRCGCLRSRACKQKEGLAARSFKEGLFYVSLWT